jgi:hypothetical protein
MVGSVFGKSRANGLRQDLDVGPHQDVEDREVAHTVKDKSLEEMASDLRSLSGQLMTARVMGVMGGVKGGVKGDPDSGIGGGIDGDADNPAMAPAVRLVGDMLVAELSRTLERLSARQREDMASLVLNHAQGMRATTDRVDRLLRGMEAERKRDDAIERSVLERLDAIAARQEELEALVRRQRRGLVPIWVAGFLALAAVGISIGSAVALHIGIQP